MIIIFGTVVSFIPFDSGGEFRGQGIGPFLPREMPLSGEADRERECLRLPRFCKYGALLVTRQVLQLRIAPENRQACSR